MISRIGVLLGKDVRILRRSPFLLAALVLYPLAIALLVGLVARFANDRPRVAFVDLDGLPEVLSVGGEDFNVDKVLRQVRAEVDLIPLSQEEADHRLANGEVVVRRAALDAAYGSADVFDVETMIGEDWLVWATLLRASEFVGTHEQTAWHRLHGSNTWGDPDRFARESVRATEKIIETGLPASLGIPARRIKAINLTHCAYGYYLAGDWPRARHYLFAAAREYPWVLRESHFWAVAARLCVGRRLSRAVRGARHRGGEEFAAGASPKRADL